MTLCIQFMNQTSRVFDNVLNWTVYPQSVGTLKSEMIIHFHERTKPAERIPFDDIHYVTSFESGGQS